jgi:hypothetical protein
VTKGKGTKIMTTNQLFDSTFMETQKKGGKKPTSNDSIRRSDGRNDILDDSLSKTPGDALDVVLLGTGSSSSIEPFDVRRVVGVEFLVCTSKVDDETQNALLFKGIAMLAGWYRSASRRPEREFNGRGRTFEDLRPLEDWSPFDAMFR